jgi:hypothetical protein
MMTNPLLEEIWAIKDRLDAEAGGDIHVFCEQLRAWSAAHPHTGPVVKNAEDLRRYREEREKEALLLREKPPGYGGSKHK